MKTRLKRQAMLCLLAVIALLQPVNLIAGETELAVTGEQWARIKSPGDFMGIDGLRDLVTDLNQQPPVAIDIHYEGGENGLLWAQQFRNRLVALGIEGSRIQLVQGVSKAGSLQISLRKNQ